MYMCASPELLPSDLESLQDIVLNLLAQLAEETAKEPVPERETFTYTRNKPKRKPLPNIVLYDYRTSRSSQCVWDYLKGYRGYLQVDGYAGYDRTDATLVDCFAHARRKVVEAQKVQANGKSGKADWAINHIGKLYRIEAEIKAKSPEPKQALRQQHAQPLLEQPKSWLDKSAMQVPPKSTIGKAIAYSLPQWPKLIRYLDDARLSIDNNRAERAIKPFVMGRKSWLLSNPSNGAEASATLYCFIKTFTIGFLICVLLSKFQKQSRQDCLAQLHLYKPPNLQLR